MGVAFLQLPEVPLGVSQILVAAGFAAGLALLAVFSAALVAALAVQTTALVLRFRRPRPQPAER